MTLLHIDSSILGQGSVSRQLSAEAVAAITAGRPNTKVVYRDLAAAPISHLSGEYLGAAQSPTGEHGATVTAELADGFAALQEFLAADTVVIGVAVYNFSVPSQLKAWVDRILVAGKTFRYGANGRPEGLVGDKRVILTISRGGFYGPGTPTESFEHAETYLRAVFGFIGIVPEVVVAEGLAVGAEQRAAGIALAQRAISALAA
jgi:FMN-dependent NADH-azoreductase